MLNLSISCGGSASAVLADCELHEFGYAGRCLPGDQENPDQHKPTKVPGLAGRGISKISLGSRHRVILSDGILYTSGEGFLGQLGHEDGQSRSTPTEVNFFRGKNIRLIATGGWHTVVASDYELYTFGYCGVGQLGIGDESNRIRPTKVVFFNGKRILNIAAGYFHTVVALERSLFTFGDGLFGQLGIGDRSNHKTPTEVVFFRGKRIQDLVAGAYHTVVVADDLLYDFGEGLSGALGHGNKENCFSPKEVIFFQGKKIQKIAARGKSTAVLADGELYTFGCGAYGQLGHGDKKDCIVPTLVCSMIGKQITAISMGDFHTLVLADGELYSFGCGRNGQLGHGDNQDQTIPKLVESFRGKYIGIFPRYWYRFPEELMDVSREERNSARAAAIYVGSLLTTSMRRLAQGVDDLLCDVSSYEKDC